MVQEVCLVLIHLQFVPPQLLFADYTDQIRLFSGLWFVMYDAMNVRYHAGVQAKELNIIRKELKNNKVLNEDFNNKISGNELKELLGHTPLEVLCGAVLGIAIGIIVPVLRI